jgi:CHAD domain-containing protein
VAARELEWQFDAADLQPIRSWLIDGAANGGGLTITNRDEVMQTDLYLDTDDQRFARSGYALRIRRLENRPEAEATLKGFDAGANQTGLRNRTELSERLEQPDPLLLMRSPGPVGDRVRAVAGRKQLQPLFEVHTRRQTLTLDAGGKASGEIALDETSIQPSHGGSPTSLRRIEIEVPENALPAFGPFVEHLRADCALDPAGLSKFEAGLASAGLRLPAPPTFGPTAIEPELTVGEVAFAVLRRQLATLVANEPGTRLGDDIEALHDMRVASRRLRAALALFEDVVPESVLGLRDDLAWIGRRLGAVRDLDVQLEQLESWLTAASPEDVEGLARLRAVLSAQRFHARAEMLDALDSSRYESFVQRFEQILRDPPADAPAGASLPALAVAPDLIDARWTRVREGAKRLGRSSEAEDYHRLRIRGKRLRYALEFLNDLYPGRARAVLKKLVRLQDLLGLHQDAIVAIERLRRITEKQGGELGPHTTFAMGEIAERYRASVRELRAQVPAAYRKIEGKRWASFRKHIEGKRTSRS